MRIILCLLLFSITQIGLAQDRGSRFVDMGLEIQQYPTGFLLGVRMELSLAAHHSMEMRLGYNTLDHKDFGVHESEIGGGLGGTLGYRYYFKEKKEGFFLGGRMDFWWNSVDWMDNIGSGNEVWENTKVGVFQPTAIGGYLFLLADQVVITPTLAAGVEVNVITRGEPVGQGAILLWGLNLAYRFSQ